jgi:hypothetical protein
MLSGRDLQIYGDERFSFHYVFKMALIQVQPVRCGVDNFFCCHLCKCYQGRTSKH